MSDHLPDTPKVVPLMCGFCYPDVDFEEYVHQACAHHAPDLSGADDAKARNREAMLTGGGEAGGPGNRDVCEQVHQEGRR